ncbi:MAG TPA: ATP-binding protein [Candidatus Kapabacteria bacterium]|nr:ATP-binding protein [Candidatus Kapabacteria bacterium]
MKTALSWSSGKDSAWALHILRTQGVEVSALLTTVNTTHQRVAMHAVRRELLEAQAKAAGVPLRVVDLPWPCPNEVYEERMSAAVQQLITDGFEHIAFGDLFLRDIREYREKKLEGLSLKPIFPLWEIPTGQLANDMIAGGLKSRITCVDPKKLDARFAGRVWDRSLLDELPPEVDPCGENGEFHTFAYEGPMFRESIDVRLGEIIERDGFVFADILNGTHSFSTLEGT